MSRGEARLALVSKPQGRGTPRPHGNGPKGFGRIEQGMDATLSLAGPRVLMSRAALLHNIKIIRRRLASGTKLCAVVKADAYGHCASLVADTLANFTCDALAGPAVDAFAVVELEEAEAVDGNGVPVHVLRPIESTSVGPRRDAIEAAVLSGWTLTVTTPAAAMDVARIAGACGRRAAVQIMIDTGQHREGAAIRDVPLILKTIDSQPALRLSAMCTHFVSSEEPANPFNDEQLRRFRSATDAYVSEHPQVIRHAANSGAVFFNGSGHLDMVRPGIAIYGIDPTCRPHVDRPLRPVLKWVAPLTMVREIPAGATVGYNQAWRARTRTRIGLVPVGYADGYLRSFSNRAMMIVRGKAVPVVGRVSMDYATVDLDGVPGAAPGDEATVLDSDPLSPASVYSLAQVAATIPYEIFCHIGQRMKRMPAEAEEPATIGKITHMPRVQLMRLPQPAKKSAMTA